MNQGKVEAVESERSESLIHKLIDSRLKQYEVDGGAPPSFELINHLNEVFAFGSSKPEFSIIARSARGWNALLSTSEGAICDAYMAGEIDLVGDMMRLFLLRAVLEDRTTLGHLWNVILKVKFFGQVKQDKEWIAQHYDYDQDFYLTFLDAKYHAYSQGIFESDSETLERGIERKLQFAFDSCRLKPGDKVLDIGGGWGAFTGFAGRQGVQVTSLTISRESEKFINRLIKEGTLPCTVRFEHLHEHLPGEQYDAIVNLGVTEHLPDYEATVRQYVRLLKPGGRLYLDASASRRKHTFSSFISRYIYPGNPTPMCLHDLLAEFAKTPFEVLGVYNDRKNYELTARRWAEALDHAETEISSRWGNVLYRKFRLYLWGTAQAFNQDIMTAYRIVLEKPLSGRAVSRWWKLVK